MVTRAGNTSMAGRFSCEGYPTHEEQASKEEWEDVAVTKDVRRAKDSGPAHYGTLCASVQIIYHAVDSRQSYFGGVWEREKEGAEPRLALFSGSR